MSKCVLVMDMPSSCDVCDFVQIDDMVGNMTCMNPVSEVYGCDVSDYIGCRADGCPLKPMPEKKKERYGMNRQTSAGYWETYGEETDSVAVGYNACIDELLKGE